MLCHGGENLVLWLFGLLNHISVWGYIAYTLILTHITVMAVTLYLHRSQAHRSLDLSPIISHFLRFWLWLTTGIVTKEWVAIHRKHHSECETPDDPHSPQRVGLRKVLLEGTELYKEEAKNEQTLSRYGKNTPDDWVERKVYAYPIVRSIGIFLMLGINIFLFGIPGLAIWAIQMMWIPFFAAGVVNGVGHFMGYRNFESPDASRNIFPIGLLMGGEELHNNHHTFAASAKLSVRRWEFDIGWFYIKILKALKLAHVHRSVPKISLNYSKTTFDHDSLKAIIGNRFHVLHDYWREVVIPIVNDEKQFLYNQGKSSIRGCGKLLVRESSIIKQEEQNFLQAMLKAKCSFRTVYHFRLKLQEIWQTTHANQQELFELVNRWCKQAEATGIAVLQNFARKLQYYSLPA
jgi:stearoyl-CoA desaturase (Delta-9 desaturase)